MSWDLAKLLAPESGYLWGLLSVGVVWVAVAAAKPSGGSTLRRAAEALGMSRGDHGSADERVHWEGWMGSRLLRMRTVGSGRGRWLVLETECLMPAGFALLLGDPAPARARGVNVPVTTAAGVEWPPRHGPGARSSDAALAGLLLSRWGEPPAGDLQPATWWLAAGQAGVAVALAGFAPADASSLAQQLLQRIQHAEAQLAGATEPGGPVALHLQRSLSGLG